MKGKKSPCLLKRLIVLISMSLLLCSQIYSTDSITLSKNEFDIIQRSVTRLVDELGECHSRLDFLRNQAEEKDKQISILTEQVSMLEKANGDNIKLKITIGVVTFSLGFGLGCLLWLLKR